MTLRVFNPCGFGAAFLLAAVGAVLAGAAQEPPRPSFEVASIRTSSSAKGDRRGMVSTGAGITYAAVTLRACLATAYDVKEYQVSGPAWVDSEHYDINAKTGGSASPEQIRLMLQSMLADRFKVTLHRETKELPVFALVVGKHGFKLQPAEGDGPHSFGSDGVGIKFDFKTGAMMFLKTSLEAFAEFLSKFPGVGRPVVDRTELKGVYDINLRLVNTSPETGPAEADAMKKALAEGGTIFGAVEGLGLKLEAQRAPVEMLMVDHAEKVPTDN